MNRTKSTLYIFSGLPGSGKTTLAKKLCRQTKAVYLRIDTIEQMLRDFSLVVADEGYRLANRQAADNLMLGRDVIADSCNPVQASRAGWQQTATQAGAEFINIEITCSSATEHRRRIESRTADIPGLKLPSWADVVNREYHPWKTDRVLIDTAEKTPGDSFRELSRKLGLSN